MKHLDEYLLPFVSFLVFHGLLKLRFYFTELSELICNVYNTVVY